MKLLWHLLDTTKGICVGYMLFDDRTVDGLVDNMCDDFWLASLAADFEISLIYIILDWTRAPCPGAESLIPIELILDYRPCRLEAVYCESPVTAALAKNFKGAEGFS